MRNTKEQTAYILQLKRQREATLVKRRPRILLAAAVASLILVAGVALLLQNLIGWPYVDNSDPTPSQIKLVSLDGVLYTPINDRLALFQMDPASISVKPGQTVGKVARPSGADFLDKDSVGIFSNFLPAGTEILEWSGYSPEFRICARDRNGTLTGLERIGIVDGLAANQPVAELLDFPNHVVEILICNNNPSEIGRITDPDVLRSLMTDLADKAYFTGKNQDDMIYVDKQFYRLYLRLADNSVTEVVMNASNGLGEWIESIQLPDGFSEAISKYIIGSTSEEEQDYGSLSAHGDLGILMLPEANGLYQDGLYVSEQAWVDGATGRLYLGQPDHWQVQLAGDAAGDVRIEGQHIYYRTTHGRAARILFAYGPDGMSIDERVQAGDDLSSFIKTREILGEGPFVRLQVRLGVIWTLDKDGTLRRDQETVARAVTSFALDPLGVTYSSDGAIWRLPMNGRSVKLAAADAVTMAAADTYLYYSPTAGGLWRMRLDGTDNRKLWDVSAEKTRVQVFCAGHARTGWREDLLKRQRGSAPGDPLPVDRCRHRPVPRTGLH